MAEEEGLRLLEWLPARVIPKTYLGHGWVMAVCELTDERRGNPRALKGTDVQLEGVKYHVMTVGTFAVMDGHPALNGPFDLVLRREE